MRRSALAKMMLASTDELRRMHDTEGIVFPGCGGDLNEWVDGVNQMFIEEGILLGGTTFSQVTAFKNEESSNLLFHFTEDVNINIGKLALWRIVTSHHWNAKWFTDYVDNYLGGFEGEELGESDEDIKIE